MATNESDPVDVTESDLVDIDKSKVPGTIEPESLAIGPPVQGARYFLTPYCCDGHNDQWLVPGMDGALGPVRLKIPDETDLATMWRTYVADDGTFRILNEYYLGPGQGTGILTAPNDDSPVVMVGEFETDGQQRFKYEQSRYNWKAVPVLDGTWYMIQLVENPGVYLNVSGDGPYPAGTQILVYSSPGPEPNQVWRFHMVSAP
jgi:hypothetical protein